MEEPNGLITIEPGRTDLTPKEMVLFATDAAKTLKDIVTTAKTSIKINGNEYLKFEAWQTIARFYHATVTVEWTKPMYAEDGLTITGFDARANVIDKTGRIIGSAESSCSREEATWKTRATFQLKSMAQTRASAKALRNVYAWVVVLSGYAPTPAEELEEESRQPINVTPKPNPAMKVVQQAIQEEQHTRPLKPKCMAQGCDKLLTNKVYDYSMQSYGVPFCYDHQQEMKKRQQGADFADADALEVENEVVEE